MPTPFTCLRAWVLAESAQRSLARTHPELNNITVAGECRRECELVSKITLVAADGKRGGEELSLGAGIKVRICPPESMGAALLLATGSPGHIDMLKEIARGKGMSLSEEGLKKGRRVVEAASEAGIYHALGLPFIAPELREGRDEFEIMSKPLGLVETGDLRGVLHAHTDRSDGTDTLEAMAEAARSRGYRYLGVTDHSQSAHYAGGLTPEEILAQHRDVDRLNRRYGDKFHIFKGIESDIRPDGSLDYPDDILRSFDFIIASVHSQFRMEATKQTARIIRAVENPHTTILGHLTGRQLLRRPGYEADIEAILKACAAQGVAVEINSHPWRLDLDWRWHQMALKLGCLLSIDPDAHSTEEIDLLRWGIAMARKGGVPRDRVLSCMDLKKFTDHLARRKSGAARKGPRKRGAAATRATAHA